MRQAREEGAQRQDHRDRMRGRLERQDHRDRRRGRLERQRPQRQDERQAKEAAP